jgi:hypothetical protein
VLDGSVFLQHTAKDESKKEEEKPAVIKRRRKEALDSLVGDIISTAVKIESKTGDDTEDVIDGEHGNAEAGAYRREAEPAPDTIPAPKTRADGRREPERKPSLLHRPRTAAFELPTPTSEPRTSASFPPTAPAQSHLAPTAAIQRVDTPETIPITPAERKAEHADQADENMDDTKPDMMFYDGLRFSHVIDEECSGLEKALVAHGGIYVPNEERLAGAEVDYVVVRLYVVCGNEENSADLSGAATNVLLQSKGQRHPKLSQSAGLKHAVSSTA